MTFFATPNPSAADVDAVATQFRNSHYDIPTLMRAIFRSPSFTAPSNYRSLVRSPTDYTVATMVALGRPDLAAEAGRTAAAMDQQLYAPPNVAGWPTGPGWVSSSTLLTRINFAVVATSKLTAAPTSADAVANQLDSVLSPATAVAMDSAHTESDRWFVLLASPEFQLK
jgi:uncharacterized protein (DUF1800 family)